MKTLKINKKNIKYCKAFSQYTTRPIAEFIIGTASANCFKLQFLVYKNNSVFQSNWQRTLGNKPSYSDYKCIFIFIQNSIDEI